MRDYLDKMAAALYDSPAPAEKPPMVLAALRQKMLTLARDKLTVPIRILCRQSIPALAREILGTGELLAPSASSDLGGRSGQGARRSA